MSTHLRHIWDKLTASYWFVPTLMMTLSVVLAFGMLEIDERALHHGKSLWWVYHGGVEGARSLLATVAGSVITVAGVVFSITIVALTQASSQFGPRLLRKFMQDIGNQVVLGTFVATFLYCLLVLRAVKGAEHLEMFVPHLATTVAMLLAVASLCVLIFFIHHVARSIQAPQVAARAASDLDAAIKRMYPENLGVGGPAPANSEPEEADLWGQSAATFPARFDQEAIPVPSSKSGYLQAVDTATLIRVAVQHDLRMKLLVRPGMFIYEGNPIQLVWPIERIDDALMQNLCKAYIIGRERTPEQDVEFVIDQLVEIALRALSPSVNDPFTALNCIDWLGVTLSHLARGDVHSPYRYDDAGELRIIAKISNFPGFVDAAFHQIRQTAHDKPAVMIRMLEVISSIVGDVKTHEQRDALRRHAQLIHTHGCSGKPMEADRVDLGNRYRRTVRALRMQQVK